VAVAGYLHGGGQRRHLAPAAAGPVIAPVLPGVAGEGLHGAIHLDDVAAAAFYGDVPSGSGVPPVEGVPYQCHQRGGMASTARCALYFLAALDAA
jgi:hypothetical protein